MRVSRAANSGSFLQKLRLETVPVEYNIADTTYNFPTEEAEGETGYVSQRLMTYSDRARGRVSNLNLGCGANCGIRFGNGDFASTRTSWTLSDNNGRSG